MAATPPPTGAAPRPLGVTINGEGIEIAVLSTAAERIEICLFDHRGETELSRHALVRGDDDIWSANLPGIGEGARYGLRADGPYDPSSGLWFDPFKDDLEAFINAIQPRVTGTVNLRLFKGNCQVTGRASKYALYNEDLASFDSKTFDQSEAVGIVKTHGMQARMYHTVKNS